MLGKDILLQAIREKCLHKLMSEEYGDEGDMFFTFFSYIQKCFAHDMPLSGDKVAQSFDACYDWSTVKIHDEERVDYVNRCVEESFATTGEYETENAILHDDRAWAMANHIKLHPNVAINNITYTNSTGEDLALAICAAYREAPDECELAWKLQTFGSDDQFNSYEGLVTPHSDEGLFSQSRESHQLSEGEIIFGSWHLYLISAVVLTVNIAALVFVRCRMKRQMQSEINSSVNAAVNQYFALPATD